MKEKIFHKERESGREREVCGRVREREREREQRRERDGKKTARIMHSILGNKPINCF
jgi:hypothetical protein